MKSAAIAAIAAVLLLFAGSITLPGQTKPIVAPSAYGRWETLPPGQGNGLSPDGRWVAYAINRSDRNNELRFTSIANGATTTIPFGAQPVFAADSQFAAYAIGMPEAQEEKLRADKKPIRKKAGVLNLTTGATAVVDDAESFAFDASGSYLAMRHYAPEPEKKPGPDATPSADGDVPAGATLVVRQLSTGRDTTFGNVAEFAWQDKGALLAMVIAAEGKTGNGVHLFDPQSGVLRVLDSAPAVYSGLAWRKEAADLAVLRSKGDERRDGSTHVVLAWTGLGGAAEGRHTYDPSADASFPAGLRTVAFRKPSWSDSGDVVFVGVAKWTDATTTPAKNLSTGVAGADHQQQGATQPPPEMEEPAGVDVWHARDVDVMPKQKLSAKADRERNMLAAWHVASGRFVQLGKELTEQVTPVKRRPLAFAATWTAYAMDRSIGRPAADLSLIDLATGERTKLKDRVDDHYASASPGGRYVLFFQDDHYWTIDTATHAIVNITKTAATSFADRESDATVKQKPPFGVAGWLKGDAAVLLYDKFDIWQIAPDGSRAARLTSGGADQIRHRYVRLDPDDEVIDPDKPIYLNLFGLWSKKSGFARVHLGTGGAPAAVETLVFADKSLQRLAKAKSTDTFQYVVERFDQPPAIVVGGATLADAKPVVKTNTFFDAYAWGRSEIVEYRSDRGERLQAALYYPAGYEPGKRYPTIVYLYERLSDGVHRWVSPSEREPYNIAAFTSLGYAVLEPDIAFRPREPGLSVVECVTPAVRKVVQMGVADSRRVGVVGHSWGGFDTTFLATHATDVFAAAVAGAPITDLVSNYGNHHWSSGIAETDHIETGQQRMEVPLWEDLPAYIRNSAVFNVQNMKTPLLIEVGDGDGTVFWHQGIELYNVARRAKKDVVLLAYAGEDHGLRKKPNQLDYHRRIVQWFGHYLKGEAAADWITNGVRYLDRERELKELKAKKPTGA